MSASADRFFEAETLQGRWLFAEIELCFYGEPAKQFTVACPVEIDEDEIDDHIDKAMELCFKARESLAHTHATPFDAGELLKRELEARGLHVLPSVDRAWESIQPPQMLQ